LASSLFAHAEADRVLRWDEVWDFREYILGGCMETTYPASLKGHFLIAMPGLSDPNFSLTITCICEHTTEGAVGVVVNRVHPFLSAKDIFDELKLEYVPGAERSPVFTGGPVHMGEVFVLHGPPFGWEGNLMVTPRLALSNTRDIIEAIAVGNGPLSFLIVLGCAGWGANQLETEIKGNSWLTCPITEEIVFDLPVESRWGAAVKKMGIDPALLSGAAGHA
jgi:putative transcriptional regulator